MTAGTYIKAIVTVVFSPNLNVMYSSKNNRIAQINTITLEYCLFLIKDEPDNPLPIRI